jgi:hypothetical protein
MAHDVLGGLVRDVELLWRHFNRRIKTRDEIVHADGQLPHRFWLAREMLLECVGAGCTGGSGLLPGGNHDGVLSWSRPSSDA